MSLLGRLLERIDAGPVGALPERVRREVIDPEIAAAIDAIPVKVNEFGYDPWGFSPEDAKFSYSLALRIFRYFRPEIRGIENIPEGRVLLVPNHSGQIPLDGVVIAVACLLSARPPRLVRPQAERWVPTLPVVNELFARSGVVVGDPINCKNLLEDENAILVFPEGVRGSGKPWHERYQLKPFGRGFLRLALQTKAPIVPVSVVGAEEAIVSIHDWKGLAKLLKMPYLPISPLLPLLGPLAYFPLPTRFYVDFGEPLRFTGPFDDEDPVIDEKVEKVRGTVQRMIDSRLQARPSVFG